MVLSVEAATLTLFVLPSSIVILTDLRFGSCLLFVLLFAWETLFPTSGPFPDTEHLLDMIIP